MITWVAATLGGRAGESGAKVSGIDRVRRDVQEWRHGSIMGEAQSMWGFVWAAVFVKNVVTLVVMFAVP